MKRHYELSQGTRKGMPLPYTSNLYPYVVWEGHPLAGALVRFNQEKRYVVACR